jgi:hypothetical protein
VSRPDSHLRYEELAAGMALHALEPEDEQDFLAHLSGCSLCDRSLVEHEAALSELAYAADPVDPPPSVLEGIRAGMRASGRPVVVADQPVTPTVPTADPAGVPAVVPAAPPASLAEARGRREQRTPRAATWLGAAAAAALVVSVGVWGNGLREQRDEQARLSSQLASTLGRLEDPATQTVRLQSDAGEVVAVALVSDTEVELVLDGLPVNGDDTSYVLWGEAPDGSVQAVGAFDVTSADLQVRAGIEVGQDTQRLLVTREPQSPELPEAPTTPVLAVGEV